MAAAAGNLFAEKVVHADRLEDVLKRAVESVQNGVGAVIDVGVVTGC